jgi:class 3 adenylate cyclase
MVEDELSQVVADQPSLHQQSARSSQRRTALVRAGQLPSVTIATTTASCAFPRLGLMSARAVMGLVAGGLSACAIAAFVVGHPLVGGVAALLALAQMVAIVTTKSGRTTVMLVFTDVSGSTALIERIGDAAWQQVFDAHASFVRREWGRARAAFVKDLGDGFLAAFPLMVTSPAEVLTASVRVVDEGARIGLPVRAGVHVGKCALRRNDIRGLAAHIGARLVDVAAPGQVIATNAVRQLLPADDSWLVPIGVTELRGVSEAIDLYAVERRPSDAQSSTAPKR